MKKGLSKGLLLATAALICAVPSWALQGAKVNMDLPQLEESADEVVEVNLEGETLEQGSKLLAIRQGVSNSVKGLLSGLKGIYRRTYRFGLGKSYETSTVSEFEQKMAGGGWSSVIKAEDKKKNESVAIYSYRKAEDGEAGVTVVSRDSSEVTVVNIVGDVDIEALVEFGMQMSNGPSINLATSELENKPVELPTPEEK